MIGIFNKIKSKVIELYSPIRIAIVLFLVLFVWLITFGEQGLYKMHQLYSLRNGLQNEKRKLEKEIAKLEKETQLLKDPDYLEATIKQELGYIKDNEIVFNVVPADE